MNTLQLTDILYDDPYVGPVFEGVFAMDELEAFAEGACVVNTSPSSERTGHWIALWIDSANECFDSYGRQIPERVKRLWKNKKKWLRNTVPLQSPLTAVCGQYCVYYLLHRA